MQLKPLGNEEDVAIALLPSSIWLSPLKNKLYKYVYSRNGIKIMHRVLCKFCSRKTFWLSSPGRGRNDLLTFFQKIHEKITFW